MKRHGNLFNKITDIDNIILAYKKARKGKSWQNTIKIFESDLENNLLKIQDSLINKTFTTSEYTLKQIYEPKERTIYRLPFNPDRIIQHSIMNILEPIWDNLFIYDSYSCRKCKGIHKASRRTMEFIRNTPNGYCLKMDISKFYPSINHDILCDIIKQKIKCKDTLELLEDIIYSIPDGKNIPIGNYLSQWFGNLYMNELDRYLKHEHNIKCYVRYCDDFLIIHKDKNFLTQLSKDIKDFLESRLKLRLSKNSIFPISQGIDFVGYRHFPGYVLLRKSTATRLKKRMKQLPGLLATNRISELQYQSSIASMLGWLKWCNSYNLNNTIGLNNLWNELNVRIS